MSLLAAIACTDRIVMLSDGLVTDDDLGIILDEPKLFKVADNCAVALSGEGIGDDMPGLMKQICITNQKRRLKQVTSINKTIVSFVKSGAWIDDPNDQSAHTEFLIARYQQSKPRVQVVFSDATIHQDILHRYYMGMDVDDDHYFQDSFEWDRYYQISYKEAERVAMDLLLRGEKKFPEDIGGKTQLWHVFPDKIMRKNDSYIKLLRESQLP